MVVAVVVAPVLRRVALVGVVEVVITLTIAVKAIQARLILAAVAAVHLRQQLVLMVARVL